MLAAGAVLGETYELIAPIGKGGMGVVWSARHLRLPGRRVAVKVLLAAAFADEGARARFRREAQIASRLEHPGIARVSDFNVLPSGEPYLVMELLEGQSLGTRLRQGPLTLPEVLDVTRQIVAALEVAHAAGVVHRDLKPDNVFLCADGIKLLDFGISKLDQATVELTADAQVLGTPRYMAPEQARGEQGAIGPHTDVFALGAMVHEMVTGRPAFAGGSVPEILFKVVFQPHPPLTGVPPHVAAAVDRALAKAADKRFAGPAAFLDALERGQAPSRVPLIIGAVLAVGLAVTLVIVTLGFVQRTSTPLARLPDAGPHLADAGARPADAAPPPDAALPDAAPAAVAIPITPPSSKPKAEPPVAAEPAAPYVILDLATQPAGRGRDEAAARQLGLILPRLGRALHGKKVYLEIEIGIDGSVEAVHGSAPEGLFRGLHFPATDDGFEVHVHLGPRP